MVEDLVDELEPIEMHHFAYYIFCKNDYSDDPIYKRIKKDNDVFLEHGIGRYDHEELMTKHFNTVDIYGLGMSCLRILLKYGNLLENPILVAKLYELFYSMITPNLSARIEIGALLEKYSGLLMEYSINRSHFDKLYMELHGKYYSTSEGSHLRKRTRKMSKSSIQRRSTKSRHSN